MEEIKISYKQSGVKTLRTTSLVFFLLSLIGSIIFLSMFFESGSYNKDWTWFWIAIYCFLIGFITIGICNALATMSENACTKKRLLNIK